MKTFALASLLFAVFSVNAVAVPAPAADALSDAYDLESTCIGLYQHCEVGIAPACCEGTCYGGSCKILRV
ncbi:hypothetical protein NA57DRAFT_70862 [Rhizodiscina lignyota]|uniref:Uncharacterized protein n=1 Tax=Rhizodiscina lignyota TaxID=1504668 RepID=A0A9P4IUR4_9PEZI|nr:hypothetical protein NA57DRAFT_70862 [Rhizodiscina lignyota]